MESVDSQTGNELGSLSHSGLRDCDSIELRRERWTLPKFQNGFVIDPGRKNGKHTKLVRAAYEVLSYRMCLVILNVRESKRL